MHTFWESLGVYCQRPNILNKRIMGFQTIFSCRLSKSRFSFEQLLDTVQSLDEASLRNRFNSFESKETQIEDIDEYQLFVRKLLPKRSMASILKQDAKESQSSVEVLLIDYNERRLAFIPLFNENKLIADCSYKVSLEEDRIELTCLGEECDWLQATVLPKLRKWSEKRVEEKTICKKSLQLIDENKYCSLYSQLKARHAPDLLEMWTKIEKTDPLKFIFEDIAIATYLLLLWQEERLRHNNDQLQSFVDLGCGNGLLVHILAAEGHRGLGIDVRKRNIWEKYPANTQLIVKTINPKEETLKEFKCDWIIGNHSDELTPWIPVIASKCMPRMRVFLLPCCPFDFNGKKYQRKQPNISQYQCYLDYISNVCRDLGFNVKMDKLRIPSTKRTCFVCEPRDALADAEAGNAEMDLQLMIETKTKSELKLRSNVEEVKNCTRIPQKLLKEIVERVAQLILQEPLKAVEFRDLANRLEPCVLQSLRKQCGGLQTLLRNHQHIFKISGGLVKFAVPRSIDDTMRSEGKIRLQSKPCWFYSHHPDGCPLNAETCCYRHLKYTLPGITTD